MNTKKYSVTGKLPENGAKPESLHTITEILAAPDLDSAVRMFQKLHKNYIVVKSGIFQG